MSSILFSGLKVPQKCVSGRVSAPDPTAERKRSHRYPRPISGNVEGEDEGKGCKRKEGVGNHGKGREDEGRGSTDGETKERGNERGKGEKVRGGRKVEGILPTINPGSATGCDGTRDSFHKNA